MFGIDIFRDNGPAQVLSGIGLIALTALASFFIADIQYVKSLGLSSLLVALLIGLLFGNTVSVQLPRSWSHGIRYCTREILRLAIILLGFSFTFQNIAAQGALGLIADSMMVMCTLIIGYFVGTKLLKMDEEMAVICSIGPAICGASAILAAESVLRTSHAKTAVAVSTVVLFGTIAMFLYPFIYSYLPHNLSDTAFGIYIGSSVHEVPQVVVAGNIINEHVAETSIIVKLTRVLMLVPVLFVLSFMWEKVKANTPVDERRVQTSTVPWWSFVFVAVVGINSLVSFPKVVISSIHYFDIFLFTMAMGAIGMETTFSRIKEIGGKPFILAFIIFFWLLFGGWMIASFF